MALIMLSQRLLYAPISKRQVPDSISHPRIILSFDDDNTTLGFPVAMATALTAEV
jgi:hypothetical protein